MAARLRVLLVDDDVEDAVLTKALLRDIYADECEVQWLASAAEARRVLPMLGHDICLMDYRLGPVDGIELVREAVDEGCTAPFIVLTGLDRRDIDIEATAAGASDYLVKGQLTAAMLERAMRYAIEGARSERALRESERRLREIAEHVRELFWVYDYRLGRLTYVNAVFSELFASSPAAAMGNLAALLDDVHPGDRAQARALATALCAGHEVDHELRLLAGDDNIRWIRARGSVVRDAAGEIIRLVGTIDDVTARRRVEARQQVLSRAGKLIAATLDPQQTLEGIVDCLVPAFADACVIDIKNEDGELVRRAYAFSDPRKRDAMLEMRRRFPMSTRSEHPAWRVMAAGESLLLPRVEPAMISQIAIEPEELALAAAIRPTSCMMVPIGSPALGVIMIGSDQGRTRFDERDLEIAEELGRRASAAMNNARLYRVADEARASEHAHASRLLTLTAASRALVEAEPRLPELLDSIADIAIEHFGELCVLRVDEPGMGAAGVAKHRRPAAARDAHDLMATPHPGDIALCRQLFESTGTFTCGAADVDSFRGWLQPAYVRYLDLHPPDALMLVPLRARGQLIGALAVAREQPTWGDAREDVLLLQDFADRAALVIENARLFNTMQHAIKSRDDVIAAVSHDVANPLNAIVAGSTLLLMNDETPSRERMLSIIKRSAEHASRIMRDLLDTAAVEVGKLSVVAVPVPIERLIAEAGEAFELAARAAGIALTTAADDVTVRADHARVVQVIANLLANAIKFTPRGGRIDVEARCRDADVHVFVRDTGRGIASHELPHVFERYFQGSAQAPGGVGLGLAICKSIVAAHGGRIWVESTTGHGSCFAFSLPRVDVPDSDGRGSETSRLRSA